MGQRTKGIAQGDTSGHANAARLQVDASRTFADTLRGIGASVGGGIERASVRKREDARYQQQRADAAEEREYQRGRQSWRDQMDYDREVYRREQDAADLDLRKTKAGMDLLAPQYEDALARVQEFGTLAQGDPSYLPQHAQAMAEFERVSAQMQQLQGRLGVPAVAPQGRAPGAQAMAQPSVGGGPVRETAEPSVAPSLLPTPYPARVQENGLGAGWPSAQGEPAPVDPNDPHIRLANAVAKRETLRERMRRAKTGEMQGALAAEIAMAGRDELLAKTEIERAQAEQRAAQERQQKEAEQQAMRQEREKALPEWDKARREAGIGDAEWGALSRSFASGEIDAKTLAGFMYRERTADRMDAGAEYRKGRDQTKDAESRRRWEANRTDRMAARKPDGTVDGDRVADVVERFVSMYGWSDNYAATLSDAEVGAGLKSQRLGPATRARFEELAQQRGIGAAPAAPAQPAQAAAPAQATAPAGPDDNAKREAIRRAKDEAVRNGTPMDPETLRRRANEILGGG